MSTHIKFLIGIIAAVLLVSFQAHAADPADSAIKGALYDIERAEKQIPSLTPNRKPNIKRVKRSLTMAQQRLQQSTNKSHESWIEADGRLQKALAAIADLEAGRMPGAAPATTQQTAPKPAATTTETTKPAEPKSDAGTQTQTQAPAAPATDRNLERASRDLARIETQVRSMREGDRGRAERFLRNMQETAQVIHNSPNKETDQWKQTAAQFVNLRNTLIHHVVIALDREFHKVIEYIDRMQPLQYLVEKDVTYVRSTAGKIWNNVNGLQAEEHPSVQALKKKFTAVGNEFNKRVANAEAEHAKLGDVKGTLAAIQQRNREIGVPKEITKRPTEADVQAYVAQVQALRKHIAEDLPYLQKINGKTPMTVEENNHFRRVLHELQHGKPQALERSMFQTTYSVDAAVTELDTMMQQLNGLNPNDVNHQANYFTGEGVVDEYMERLNAGLEAVRVARIYDAGIGRTDAPNRDQQEQALNQTMAAYQQNIISALDAVRMPKAKSEDPDLLAAAEEVLTGEKYGFSFERLVINYGPFHREKKSGSIESGTVSSTVTVYTYIWDEFQATTAEKVGDKYYKFANSFRYYTSGSERTPLNRWVLYNRFQSGEILADNIHK